MRCLFLHSRLFPLSQLHAKTRRIRVMWNTSGLTLFLEEQVSVLSLRANEELNGRSSVWWNLQLCMVYKTGVLSKLKKKHSQNTLKAYTSTRYMDDFVETILQKFEFMKDKAIRLITYGLNKKRLCPCYKNLNPFSYTGIPYAKFGWIWSVALKKCPCNFIIPWKGMILHLNKLINSHHTGMLCVKFGKIDPVVQEKTKMRKQW